MKKIFFTLFLAIMATTGLYAQQISVVSSNGSTTLFQTLPEAIKKAASGSVIYLPGGGFQISDDVKINKKLTIIGIGYKANSDNADGNTTIAGNLFFEEGSSSSAVIGCYIGGNVYIGTEDAQVDNILIRCCNLNSVQVKNSLCQGTEVNQNYVRTDSYFANSNVTISNSIIGRICDINPGVIKNNVVCCTNSTDYGYAGQRNVWSMQNINNAVIANNIIRFGGNNDRIHSGSNCETYGNYTERGTWGDKPTSIDAGIGDVLVNINNWSVSPASNFHFKDDYKQYESKVGIYAGTGFKDSGMAPVPYIVAKDIPDHTDASGKLNIKIRVKAGE